MLFKLFCCTGTRGIVYPHDPRHDDVDLGLEHGNCVQTNTSNARRDRRRARAFGSSSAQQVQVANVKMFVPQSRSRGHNIHSERVIDAKPTCNRALPS